MSTANLSVGDTCEWSLSDTEVTIPLTLALTGLSLLSVFIIFGNLLVILAVGLCKNLRRKPTNFFILSLAVADFAVGTLVLPFSTINTGLKRWIFGQFWCQTWLMLDVLLCTASIYNLVAISVDRLIAILSPLSYAALITHKRIRCIILGVWILSSVISIPPIIPWNNSATSAAYVDPCSCTPLNNSPSYVVFSALSSFYLPFVVVIGVYVKIFIVARSISKSNQSGYIPSPKSNQRKLVTASSLSLSDTQESLESTVSRHQVLHAVGTSILAAHIQLPKMDSPKLDRSAPVSIIKSSEPEGLRIHKGAYATPKTGSTTTLSYPSKKLNRVDTETSLGKRIPMVRFKGIDDNNDRCVTTVLRPTWFKHNFFSHSLKAKKESKRTLKMDIRAAKTVAIVTGCFICCWLGFAIVYLLSAFEFCENNSCVPELVSSFVFWLGYVNSGLNVLIYAMFSNQFREAFKSVLTLTPNKKRSYYSIHSNNRYQST